MVSLNANEEELDGRSISFGCLDAEHKEGCRLTGPDRRLYTGTANAPLETTVRRSAQSQLRCARLPCQCGFFVEVYLYCAGLGYCFLGESNCQHTVSVVGPCALSVERLRQMERTDERAVAALHSMVTLYPIVFREAPLTFKRQSSIFHLDLNMGWI
jgi:hypothetical protein